VTAPSGEIDCGESGVTLRFTIPISSLASADIRLKGAEALLRRPLQPLVEAMKQMGVEVALDQNGVRVQGHPLGGRVQLPGDVSSQFISGLLLAGPLMTEGLELKVTSPLESRGYVSLTLEAMKRHGVDVEADGEMSRFKIAPGQTYKTADHDIPGDYSSSAFLMSAAAVTGSKILLQGLSEEETDPDSAFMGVLSEMGVKTSFAHNALTVEGAPMKAVNVSISDCPDLGPVVAVLGCYADGETRMTGARRLRYKESDRLQAMINELRVLGGEVNGTDDGLTLSGPTPLHGGTVDSHGDHRIAMALTIAALNATDRVVITNAQCVSKSYPSFFNDIRSLGVEVVER